MCGTTATDLTSQGPQQLQAGGFDVPPDEDPGWLALAHWTMVSSSLDPLWFAYQPGIGENDAVIGCLHRSWRKLGVKYDHVLQEREYLLLQIQIKG